MVFGQSRTIAMVEPGPSPISEREFHRYSLDRASILTTRIPFDRMTNVGLREMIDKLPFAVGCIVGARPGVIAINSFTGSCLKGREIVNTVQQLTGAPAIVPADEMVKHLIRLRVSRIALVSPFSAEFNMLERIYFDSRNIEVAGVISIHSGLERFRPDDPYIITGITPESILRQIREAKNIGGVGAVVLDSPTFVLGDLIDELELFIKVPIMSTNQILLYSAFNCLGIPTENLVVSRYLDQGPELGASAYMSREVR
ncbi:MAG: hypothetical protein LBP33_10125 [Candidatus Adiutrix sp.]|jgi:maleate cis-trans isomerase|nr:hypothetical protein [Candidatus Adiutrix sp.]